MKFEAWKIAWDMMLPRERKMSFLVLLISIIGGVAQVMMIAAIMPFLSFVSGSSDAELPRYITGLQARLGLADRYEFAMFLGGVAVAAIVLSNAILLLRSYMISRFTVMRIHSLSGRLLKSYLSRPYDYFLGRNAGDIGKRILSETSEISSSFLQPAAELVASMISSIFILAMLLLVEPVGTLLGGGVIAGLYFGIQIFSGRYVSRIGEVRAAANKSRFLAVNEIFGGIKEVKVLQKEDVYMRRFETASRDMLHANWKGRLVSEVPRYLIQTIFFGGIIGACMLLIDPGAFRATGEAVTSMIPALGVFAFAGQRLVPELQKVYSASSRIAFGAAALRNVHEDMARPSSLSTVAPAPVSFDRTIALNDVGYCYPGSTAGLSSLTLEIPKGQRVGIVGGTGAGKTTLVDLLLGLLAPQVGRILIDGAPLDQEASRRGWRQKVSYVPQSIFLSDASLAENIAFGVPPGMIDMDRVRSCSIAAQLHDFVEGDLPDGYDTVVGDRGARLSGGQRQRIGIARALYQDTEVLVLDEATSALDVHTERAVMEAIDAMPNKTVVTIAHRLDTLRSCDRLLVLDHGRLIEDGTWTELVARGGAFASMTR